MILFIQLVIWAFVSVLSAGMFSSFKEVFDSPTTGGFIEIVGLLAVGISIVFYVIAGFSQLFGALSIERKKSQFGWYVYWGFATQVLLLTFEKEIILFVPLGVLALDILVQVCIKSFRKPKEGETPFMFGL